MNTGIGDAWNLAWKLGYVIDGRADASLLDSYQAERHPVAVQILHTSDRAFQGFVSPNPVMGWLRGWLAPVITSVVGVLPGASGRAARAFSQLEIAYPHSPVVGAAVDLDPPPGARLPDIVLSSGQRLHGVLTDSPRHHLLLCTQVAPEVVSTAVGAHHRSINVVELPAGTLGGGAILVRPDGHVEYRTDERLSGLADHLSRIHRPATGG